MPVEKESKLARLVEAARAGVPTLQLRFKEWASLCRAEPALIWQTPAVRYVTYGLGVLILMSVVTTGIDMLAPGGKQRAPRAKTADFRVICTSNGCSHQFIVNRKFDFHRFPVKCPKCQETTGQRTSKCHSESCKGKWVVPVHGDEGVRCPNCRSPLSARD